MQAARLATGQPPDIRTPTDSPGNDSALPDPPRNPSAAPHTGEAPGTREALINAIREVSGRKNSALEDLKAKRHHLDVERAGLQTEIERLEMDAGARQADEDSFFKLLSKLTSESGEGDNIK